MCRVFTAGRLKKIGNNSEIVRTYFIYEIFKKYPMISWPSISIHLLGVPGKRAVHKHMRPYIMYIYLYSLLIPILIVRWDLNLAGCVPVVGIDLLYKYDLSVIYKQNCLDSINRNTLLNRLLNCPHSRGLDWNLLRGTLGGAPLCLCLHLQLKVIRQIGQIEVCGLFDRCMHLLGWPNLKKQAKSIIQYLDVLLIPCIHILIL